MAIKAAKNRPGATDDLTSLLAPLSRMLIANGVGVNELIQAVKLAYLDAAIDELFPGSMRINISRLSVVTGLTRKEVSALLKKSGNARSARPQRTREQRALRVLRGWTLDPRFRNAAGQPAELSLRGGSGCFAELVAAHGGDVTPVSVLKELERMQLVRRTPAGGVRLLRQGVRRRNQTHRQLGELARFFGDFANTVGRPLNSSSEPPVFFGFRDTSELPADEAARFQRVFARRASLLLEDFEQWLASRPATAIGRARPASRRVGIGVYLVDGAPGRPKRRAVAG